MSAPPIVEELKSLSLSSPTVEELAQRRQKYLEIVEEQSSELRKTPSRLEAAYNRIQQSPFTAQLGQQWQPSPEQEQAYLDHMDEICNTVPSCDDDRMKIVFAGYAAITFLSLSVIGKQPEHIQRQVSKRSSELNDLYMQRLSARGLVNLSSLSTPRVVPEPYSGPPSSSGRHRLTEGEREVFLANPMSLVGRQFIHQPDYADSEHDAYTVVGTRYSKQRVSYEVQFVDCVDSFEIESEEMECMLGESLLVEESDPKELPPLSDSPSRIGERM